MARPRVLLTGALLVSAGFLSLAGCGGSSSSSPPVSPTARPTINPPPTTPPTSASGTVPVGAAGSTVALPAFGGYSPSFIVPSPGAPAGTTTTATVSTAAPAGGAVPMSAQLQSSSPATLLYIAQTFSSPITFASYATWTVGLPAGSAVSPSSLTLEIFDASSKALVAAATGSGAGSPATFVFHTPGAWTILAGHPYLIEIVSNSNLNLSFKPNGNGSTFAYAGTLSETFVRPPLTVAPTPNPNPTYSATLAADVAVAVTVNNPLATSAPTALPANAVDYHAVETDVYTTNPKTLTTTSDSFVDFASSGTSTSVNQIASVSTTSDGTVYEALYPAGTGLLDVLPETPGALTPNSPAVTNTESNTDGQTSARTYGFDGSYTEADVYPGNVDGSVTTAATGAAMVSFPLYGYPNTTVALAPPTGTLVSGGTITATVTYSEGLQSAGFANTTRTYGNFYGAAPPLTLFAQQFTNQGYMAVPASCGVPAALKAGPANAVVQTSNIIDPAFGEIETLTTTNYNVQGLGTVCSVLSDTVAEYYDFTGQTVRAIYTPSDGTASPTPIQTTTTSETLALQSATVVGTTAFAGRASEGIAVARAATARFSALIERRRVERHAADLAGKPLSAARSMR